MVLFGADIIDLWTHVVGESKPCYTLCTTKNGYQQISPTYQTPRGKQAKFSGDDKKQTARGGGGTFIRGTNRRHLLNADTVCFQFFFQLALQPIVGVYFAAL